MSETVEGSFSLEYLWAKTAAGGDSTWHPLILHLIDVAASCDAILSLEPESTRARLGLIFGLPWDEARPWLLLLAAAHDLGKACPGFQLKWPPVLAKTGLSFPQGADTNVHHGFVSQIALSTVLIEEHGWPVELADLAADAVGCHHGERASESAKDRAMLAIECGNPTTRAGWKRARSAIITALCDVFRTGSPPTKPTLSGPDFMLLAGLVSFSDWIGSNETYFAFGTGSDCDDLRDWFTTRRDLAGKALSSIGWLTRTPLSHSENAFEDVFHRPPRPLQRAMAEVLQTIDEPAVILVEAPMGEGKTEAAFFAHLELQRRFTHRGMYLALPSKATGNAMFKRTREFLDRRGCGRELDLQLLHGAKLLNDEFQRIRFSQISDPRPGGEVRAAEWFTSKKRSLLSEYGVGTLDQAITPILPVRHNFVRLWGLANRVVVLDEIHAYDTYTGTLLLHLVSWLQALGSSVVLLSATLSPSARRSLAKATGSVMPAEEVPYPRLSVFGRGALVEQHHFEADASRRLTIELRHIGIDVAKIRASIDESMPANGMGLALVNTVQRAQDLYREFPDGSPMFTDENRVGKQLLDGTQVLLFHGRFPAEERQQREDLVLASFGPTANRAGRRILIATQVAEQSLDLDFDLIVSDLAPIDLVLQRAGRLWRHDVPNRPVAFPVLFVSGLDAQVPPTFGRPLWWGKVYREDVLLRTWALLHGRDHITLPDDIDPMVRSVYEETVEIPERLIARLSKAISAEGEAIAHRTQAHMAIIGLPNDASWNDPNRFVQHDEDDPGVHRTLMARTRLGESVIAIPIYFGDGYRPDETPELTKAKRWFLRSISISRVDIVRDLRKIGVPPGWGKSPLLRNCFPLVLDEGGRWLEGSNIRLDNDLGLVYEARDAQ